MPQTTYLPVYTAEYPILAKAQKPGGVTVLSAVGAGDVPNKTVPFTATIQMAQELMPAAEAEENSGNPGNGEEAESESVPHHKRNKKSK
jgi:hypothetical protein